MQSPVSVSETQFRCLVSQTALLVRWVRWERASSVFLLAVAMAVETMSRKVWSLAFCQDGIILHSSEAGIKLHWQFRQGLDGGAAIIALTGRNFACA